MVFLPQKRRLFGYRLRLYLKQRWIAAQLYPPQMLVGASVASRPRAVRIKKPSCIKKGS
jgi:hypothetical protein